MIGSPHLHRSQGMLICVTKWPRVRKNPISVNPLATNDRSIGKCHAEMLAEANPGAETIVFTEKLLRSIGCWIGN